MLNPTGDRELLARLDLGARFGDVGPVLVMGSYVSGLMCWRDLDVGEGRWRIDLSIWLRDLHGHVAAFHSVAQPERGGSRLSTGALRPTTAGGWR